MLTASERTRGRASAIAAFGITLTSAIEGNGMSLVARAIVTDFRDPASYPWVYTFFMLASVAGILMTPRVVLRWGASAFLFLGAGFVVSGGVLCGWAPSMAVFTSGRVIQGVAVGGVTVIVFAWAAARPGRQGSRRALAMIGGSAAIAAAVGPLVGSAFVELASWRVFIAGLSIVLGAFITVLAACQRRADGGARLPPSAGRGLWVAAVLFTAASTAVAQMLTALHPPAALVAAGLSALALFVTIRRGLVRWSRTGRALVAAASTSTALFAVATYGLAAAAEHASGYLLAAIVLSCGAAGWYAARLPLIDRLTARTHTALLAAPVIALIATALLAALASDLWPLAASWFACGLGFGAVVPRLQALLYASVPEHGVVVSAVLQITVSLSGALLMTSSDLLSNVLVTTLHVPEGSALLSATAMLAGVAVVVVMAIGLAQRVARAREGFQKSG